jgi:hypothetical protein
MNGRAWVCFVVLVALAGCGNSGIQGVLSWKGSPRVGAGSASGIVQNTTSHSQRLEPSSMRLLDYRGRKVAGHIRVGRRSVPAHQWTSLLATWKSGKPVRIDYGAGTLALPSK